MAADTEPSTLGACVLAQACLVGAGSLEVAWSAGLRHQGRHRRAAARYLTLEVPRALRRRSVHLPGLAELAGSIGAGWPPSASAEESLRRALTREPLPDPLPWFGTLAQSVPVNRDSEAICRDQASRSGPDESAVAQAETHPDAAVLAKFLADLGIETRENWLRRLLLRSRSESSGSVASEGLSHTRAQARRGGDSGGLSWRPGTDSRTWNPLRPVLTGCRRESSRFYPEFDVRRMTLRPERCTVRDIDATGEWTGPPLAPLADPELRRRLARVVMADAPNRRHSDGTEIDLDAVIDARATRAATGHADERLWMAPRPRRPDLAVSVLLDLSGSVSSTASGVTTHRRQIETAEVIADALHAVGARVAVHGFRSHNRHNVELVRILPFGAPWNGNARERMHACEPSGFTRVGAAIRRVADVIDDDKGASRRVLILVSDGVAYDHGYSGAYAAADTRHALSETRARSIATLCVTVGADTREAELRQVFGDTPRVRARAVGELRGPLPSMIWAALRSANRTS
ncbi:nitric oxide reductase activation protein NorD [Mycolicibacterium vanbaalenii]|uniref:nitric oxide reductase activation protein NorD n=1 Tax=Mycolicibacterium vanbaalenii TaxID=110539 RepID=UPI0013307E4F|nr:VWA domain-containing protein [Mycolicibacterium vanbaalenii]